MNVVLIGGTRFIGSRVSRGLRGALGWAPRLTVDEALEDTVRGLRASR